MLFSSILALCHIPVSSEISHLYVIIPSYGKNSYSVSVRRWCLPHASGTTHHSRRANGDVQGFQEHALFFFEIDTTFA